MRPFPAILVSALLASAWPSASRAGLPAPSPLNSLIPCGITLVGVDARGVPDSFGEYTVLIKDYSGNTMAGVAVTLDFSGCPGISLCSNQPDPAVIVDCARRKATGITNGFGILHMTLVGGGTDRSESVVGCATVIADGVIMRTGSQGVSVSVFDQEGGDGITGADLSLFLGDWLSGHYEARSDFDYAMTCSTSPGITGADFAIWTQAWLSGGYSLGCNSLSGHLCP